MKRTMLLACVSFLLVAAIIRQPEATFQASLQGLTLWWTIIFPGLMPFLVLFELMSSFGVTVLIGRLLEPLMQRLFRLPGCAGLALAAGWTGGYAAGSEASAALRRKGQVTQEEGQRLLALAHMPNPLFMLVVIGAGFAKQPMFGVAAAIAVWTGALLAALLSAWTARAFMRGQRYGEKGPERPASSPAINAFDPNSRRTDARYIAGAVSAMREAHLSDGRSFGQALGDSTISAVQKLLTAGGFIIIGAVLVRLVESVWDAVESWLHLPYWLLPALLESHLGSYAAATWNVAPSHAAWPIAAVAGALAWSGLGAITQSGSAIAGTDLKLPPFIRFRAFHALLSAAIALLVWKPLSALSAAYSRSGVTAVFSLPGNTTSVHTGSAIRAADLASLWPFVPTALTAFTAIVMAAALLSLSGRYIRGAIDKRR